MTTTELQNKRFVLGEIESILNKIDNISHYYMDKKLSKIQDKVTEYSSKLFHEILEEEKRIIKESCNKN